MAKPSLILVTLTSDQIEQAKATNGKRKQITHAFLCGPYGKIFGTEMQCRKCYSVKSMSQGANGDRKVTESTAKLWPLLAKR